MKHFFKLTLISLLCFSFIQAQVPPEAFNYSAVARDPQGQPIANSTIGIQINILKSSTIGVSQYIENHFVNTDDFGLFNLVIGAGAVQSGSMGSIEWATDDFYLRVGMDANGGTNFLTMGTTQLLSVPYALHAKTAQNGIDHISANGDTVFLSNGQFFTIGNSGTTNPCAGVTCPPGSTCVNGVCVSSGCAPCGVFDGTASGQIQIALTQTDTTFTNVPVSTSVSFVSPGEFNIALDISSLLGAPPGTLVPDVNGTLSGTTITVSNQNYIYQGILTITLDGTIDFDATFDNILNTTNLTFSSDAVGSISFNGVKQ